MRITLASLFLFMASVFSANAQDSSFAGQDDFVEAVIDNPTPFVGQQMVYRFRFYTAVQVQTAPNYSPPDFEGFWQAETFTVAPSTQHLGDRQYAVSEVRTVLYPLREGQLAIAPGMLIFPETLYANQRTLLTHEGVVQVQPLPAGAPLDFSGAVGQFDMLATIDRQAAALGELMTLRVTVTGSGNVEQLSAPVLPVPGAWRIYENPASYRMVEQGGLLIGEKTFEWLLLPDQPGVHTLPPVTLSYFDPQTLAYRSISTAPVSLEILPPEPDSGLAATAQAPSTGAFNSLTLKPVPVSLQTRVPDLGLLFWLLWVVSPTSALIAAWWVYKQAQQRRNRSAIRQSSALRRAHKHLESAQAAAPDEAYRLVVEAVFGYIADRLDCPAEGLEPPDLQRMMQEQGIDSRVIEQVSATLELSQEMRYAPGDVPDAGPLIRRTYQLLSAVDAAWDTA